MLAKCRLWMVIAQQPHSRSHCGGAGNKGMGECQASGRAAAGDTLKGQKRAVGRSGAPTPLHSLPHDRASAGRPRRAWDDGRG